MTNGPSLRRSASDCGSLPVYRKADRHAALAMTNLTSPGRSPRCDLYPSGYRDDEWSVTANEVWQSACMPKGRSPRCDLYPLGHRDDEKAMGRLGAATQERNPTPLPANRFMLGCAPKS